MASFVKFQNFVEDLGKGVHDFSTDTLKVYLTNATPSVSLDAVKADLAEITAQNGYPAGGADVTNTWVEATGTATLDGTNIVLTASGGAFGPFRYIILYNDTPTSPPDPVIGFYDYGSSVSVTDPETLTYSITTNIFTVA